MKRNKIVSIITSTIMIGAIGVTTAFATSPGTSSDPLVSKSYVDDKVAQIMSVIEGVDGTVMSSGTLSDSERTKVVTEVVKQIEVLELAGESSRYIPVNATNGQVILGGEGCEIILRSGTSVAFVPATDGVVNATTGSNLMNGASISKDNIIIVPREDGRGVRVTSDDAWFIIKGDYTVR